MRKSVLFVAAAVALLWARDASALSYCGSGLYCRSSQIPGSTACTQPGTGATLYCCPSGQTITSDGRCSGMPPYCGSGLYCSVSYVSGSSACTTGMTKWYCCPSGQKIVNGICSSLSVCGSGLYCYTSYITGSAACLSGTTKVYCCPSGQKNIGGKCMVPPPACIAGRACTGSNISGSAACMNGSTLQYCCPSGQTIVNGICSSVPACGSGLYCYVSQIGGSAGCLSGTTKLYCCPSGQQNVGGSCAVPPPACIAGRACTGSNISGSAACMSGSTLQYCCPSGQIIVNGACAAVDPFCVQNCGCDSAGNNCNFGAAGTDMWCRCCVRNCGGQKAACDTQGYTPTCTNHFTFCDASCGCDARAENCNFGTANTDPWCKCCAENCESRQASCTTQGYDGDAHFPVGTSRQCGCLNPNSGNDHDFTLADNANLAACYNNLRANPGVTAGYQVIWHPGQGVCSSAQHMHMKTTTRTGLYLFGIDCLRETTYNGQTCSSQQIDTDGDGQPDGTCYFLWQGASGARLAASSEEMSVAPAVDFCGE